MGGLVSVIIPTFNRQAVLLRAVYSVLSQTYKNIELIVVDDGSTDQSLDLLANLSDTRLKVISTEGRKGANFARNLGVKNASGEIVAFQDSDDAWLIDKLEKQLTLMELNNADAVFSSFIRLANDEVSIKPFKEGRQIISNNNGLVSVKDCLRSNLISTQTLVMRKSVFKALNGFDNSLKRLQDWDLAIRLLDSYKVYFLNEPTVNVYEQNDSISVKPELALEVRKVFFTKYQALYKRFPKLSMLIKYDYFKLKLKFKLGLV